MLQIGSHFVKNKWHQHVAQVISVASLQSPRKKEIKAADNWKIAQMFFLSPISLQKERRLQVPDQSQVAAQVALFTLP